MHLYTTIGSASDLRRLFLNTDDGCTWVYWGNHVGGLFFKCGEYSKCKFVLGRCEFLRLWLCSFGLTVHFEFINFLFIIWGLVCVLSQIGLDEELDGRDVFLVSISLVLLFSCHSFVSCRCFFDQPTSKTQRRLQPRHGWSLLVHLARNYICLRRGLWGNQSGVGCVCGHDSSRTIDFFTL